MRVESDHEAYSAEAINNVVIAISKSSEENRSAVSIG